MLTGDVVYKSFLLLDVVICWFPFLIYVLVRSAAVDSSGREFNRNRLIALMSAIVLEEVSISF